MKPLLSTRSIFAALLPLLLPLLVPLLLLPSCSQKKSAPDESRPRYETFRDIPGVTDEEIAAIEAFKASNPTLVYGMVLGTESFYGQDGEVRGFSARLTDYLSGLFGIKIKPQIYEWDEMVEKFHAGEIDFMGDLNTAEVGYEDYHERHMTDPIAVRTIQWFRVAGSLSFANIAETRRLRIGFLEDTPKFLEAAAMSDEGRGGDFDTIFVSDYTDVFDMLASGVIDAFVDEHTAIVIFEDRPEIAMEEILPISYSPISITAAMRPELEPIISVLQKALRNGLPGLLVEMYNEGERDYSRHVFERTLTDEERGYMYKRDVVLFAAETANYPMSFYNRHENQWQGIVFDVLKEVEALTGMSFRVVNSERAGWNELVEILERGDAAMISELIRTRDREGRFLWLSTKLMESQFVLVSKSDFRDIRVNEILNLRVGIAAGTAHEEIFNHWFPNHPYTFVYENTVKAFDALERDDIDLIMTGQNFILMVTNYMERVGFKINFAFDRSYESTMGFNRNEVMLRSVMDKAVKLVDARRISDRWMRRTFDYRVKMAQSRQPLLIGLSALFFCVIALLFALYRRSRTEKLRSEKLVRERTAELNEKNALLELVSMTDQLTGIANRRCFDSRAKIEWSRAIREKSPVSILMVDADRFKTYNDTYGHMQGDVLLKAIADALSRSVKRATDVVARWGGEEFAILLPGTEASPASMLAEKIRADVESTVVPLPDNSPTRITVSVGVYSQTPSFGDSIETFITKADRALYAAKDGGRNTVVVYKSV